VDIKGKRLMVIGGAGLIGSHVVDELLKTDVKEVIVYDNFFRGSMDNLSAALKDPRVSIAPHGGDILQRDILERAMDGCHGVFHLAALWILQCHEYPDTAFDVNVRGTFNVAMAAIKCGVEKVVYSSSASVYGDAVDIPMDESHPYNNTTFYGASKIAGEHFFKSLDRIEQGQRPIVYGDGSQQYDFVHVHDVARANLCAMQSSASGECYNIGRGIGTTIQELTELLLRLSGSALEIEYETAGTTFVTNRVGCPNKAKADLGFEWTVSLEEGMRSLMEWRRDDIAAMKARRQRIGGVRAA